MNFFFHDFAAYYSLWIFIEFSSTSTYIYVFPNYNYTASQVTANKIKISAIPVFPQRATRIAFLFQKSSSFQWPKLRRN